MTTYTPNDTFSDAQILDLSDQVKGGTNGDANVPLKAMFDQAYYVKNRLWRYDDIAVVTASSNVDNTIIGKIIQANATGANIVLSLDPLANFPVGYVLPINATCNPGKNVTVTANGVQLIILNGGYADSSIYMHDGETLFLLRAGGYWQVIAFRGNFVDVGQPIDGYINVQNTLPRNGSLLNRDDYPRLWKWINEKVPGNMKVSDATWSSDPLINGVSRPLYRGLFSTGNGSTTFRLPDDRGMFNRYLDLGRGLDTGRTGNTAGSFEDMLIQAHSHELGYYKNDTKGGDQQNAYYLGNDTGATPLPSNVYYTKSFGGSETRPINTAKIPLIKY